MNNCTEKMKNKYNSSGEYTRLVTKMVLTFLLSSVVAYIYISYSNKFSLLLLADDMAYAIRSEAVIGGIGFWVVRRTERKVN